jgi:predicted lipoprotein
LLFNESLDHTCPPQAATTSNWNTLDDSIRRQNRCKAALAIAEDVAAAAVQLRDAWLETGGDFRSEYISESNVGNSLQMTTDAIFYVDTGVKDKKLGIPLGINDACSAFSCPGSVESPYSETSFANIKNNVETFLEVFQGASGVGFDDLISEEGYPEVSQRIVTNSQAVIAALEEVSTSVIDQVNSISDSEDESQCNNAFANPENSDSLSACSIYGLIKRITDDLKIDFVTIVNVNLPSGAQSDND